MLSSFKSKIWNVYCPVYILELLTSVIYDICKYLYLKVVGASNLKICKKLKSNKGRKGLPNGLELKIYKFGALNRYEAKGVCKNCLLFEKDGKRHCSFWPIFHDFGHSGAV
jgi:hypothetical protein